MPRRRRPPRPGALADLSPLRILTQILILQTSYYTVALILILFTTIVAGRPPSLSLLLDWHNLRSDVTSGWTLGLCWMLDSLITVIPILLLIARSKLVPDFALTIHGVHLVVTSFYSRGLPTKGFWWVVQGGSVGLMVGVGVWACRWRELKPMAFGGKGKERAADTSAAVNGHAPEDGEGYAMGGGRGGRGRDGGGNYEMVGMAPKEPA